MIPLKFNDENAENHFDLVKPKIIERIDNILKKGITRDKKLLNLDVSIKSFLEDLKNDRKLKLLIVAKPYRLISIINILINKYPDITSKHCNLNFILKSVFINKAYKDLDKGNFINNIGIDTCPYCNRNYIYSLDKKDKIKPEIDHFFPTSKYPFLGVSYYNLIPSCQTCNGIPVKGSLDPIEEKMVNPYLLKSNSFTFDYKINSIDVINTSYCDKSSISIILKNKIEGNNNVFKLDKLYEKHTDHALELIIKSKIKYSEKYRDYLNSYQGFNFNYNEINRLIIGNYSQESEIHKRPLAKMYQDIAKELGLI